MLEKYTNDQINDELQRLNSMLSEKWSIQDNSLYKNFVFKDCEHAFKFMRKVAIDAERLNHDPEWNNTYNKVEIKLINHEAGGVTGRDFELAKAIETSLMK